MFELKQDAFEVYKNFVIERNRVWKRRTLEGKTFPWTNDKILQSFRFTNIKRTQDRESLWLINNICNNVNLSYKDKIFNCILFRTWNKGETFEALLGKGISIEEFKKIDISIFKKRCLDYKEKHPKYLFFTNAFKTSGLKNAIDKNKLVPLRPIYFAHNVLKTDVLDRILKSKDSEEVCDILMELRGISYFLGYQIWVDICYTPESPFTEDDFVIAGPGCKVGIDNIAGMKDNETYEDFLWWLWENQEELFKPYDLKEEFNYDYYYKGKRVLSMEDLENSFCEFSKYYRIFKNGKGKTRKFCPRVNDVQKLF